MREFSPTVELVLAAHGFARQGEAGRVRLAGAVEGCAGAGLTGLQAQLLTAAIRALTAPRGDRALVVEGLRDVLSRMPTKAPKGGPLPLLAGLDA